MPMDFEMVSAEIDSQAVDTQFITSCLVGFIILLSALFSGCLPYQCTKHIPVHPAKMGTWGLGACPEDYRVIYSLII